TNTASFTVTVIDDIKPTISGMPANITVRSSTANSSSCTQVATWTAPTASDNCTVQSLNSNYPSGSSFPVGTTTVTYTALDVHGNTNTASFTVTVIDDTKPTLTAVPNRNENVGSSCGFTIPDYRSLSTASDNCTILSVSQSPSAGTVISGAGTTQLITFTATDVNGNTQTTSFTITLKDVTAPVVTCKPGGTRLVNVGNAKYTVIGSEFDATATDNCTLQTLAYSLSGATNAAYNTANTSLSGVKLNVGTTTITWQATDASGNSSTCTTVVTVNKRQTKIIYTSSFGNQYSDVATATATLSYNAAASPGDPVNWQPLSGRPVTFNIGSQSASATTGNPSGVALTPVQILQAPGTYNVSAAFAEDTAYLGSTDVKAGAFTVTQEDARIDYTGDVIKATPTATSTSALVTLRANILDMTAVDMSSDPNAGDIRNAKVMFVNRDADTSISGWIPVATLVNASDPKVGTVSFDWPVSLGSGSNVEINVGIIVDNGYYIRNSESDNVIVTVYQPNGDFITGGGFITNTKSVGSMKADQGSRTNFGFNVKFNKKSTNLQGNLNFIFRRTEADHIQHVYQVKSNAMQSLGVNATNLNRQTANFVSKGNITDITNPLSPISMGGNKTMYVNMIDNGEPGTRDSISFVLVDGLNDPTVLSNILYSSNWTGTRTDMMNLTGGNLVVHSGFNVGSGAATTTTTRISTVPVIEAGTFTLRGYPNPSNSQFNLQIQSSNRTDKIQIRVIDLSGKVIEEFNNLNGSQSLKIGAMYRPGVYIVEMIQGSQRKQLKLIKQPD
ncbi:MAG: HYR domain-containing protein, partial [Flavisolibacter sp.]